MEKMGQRQVSEEEIRGPESKGKKVFQEGKEEPSDLATWS